MSKQGEVSYDRRSLRDWIKKADAGEIALADFQRSFVWDRKRSANYIRAILDGKPVGLYLILKVAKKPQFEAKAFSKSDIVPNKAGELVLDGQQRLTSLLQALHGRSNRRVYAEMENLSAKELAVKEIIYGSDSRSSETPDDPSKAYAMNRIPMDVLIGEPDEKGLTPLQRWCTQAVKNDPKVENMVLYNQIHNFFEENFFNRELYYCNLPSSIDTRTATNIFVDTNQSSVRISPFDVEVAVARGEHGKDIRALVKEAYSEPENSVLRHYFRGNEEDWIPDIGEWMFKVACMHANKPPRDRDFRTGLEDWLIKENKEGVSNLRTVFADLSWALKYAARLGGATRRTLPSWPPVHVFAALRKTYVSIKDPVKNDLARKLLEGYYWRCLFSNRYDSLANQRLFEDFRVLRTVFEEIKENGTYSNSPPVFDEENHPLYHADELLRNASWIGSTSRSGRALASVAISSGPAAIDWVTGAALDAEHIRELEKEGNLDRHHIFPKKLLQDAQESKEFINSALNGVLLDARANRKLSKHAPKKYVEKVIKESQSVIAEQEMQERVESHLTPYDEMIATGGIRRQYKKFLERRADILAKEIARLASVS